jgi:anti-anti-sigma factor
MQASISKDAGKALIKLSGRFDFNTHREFRGAYEPLVGDAETRSVVVDFSNVDYLDSSALGMLLMLRDKLAVPARRLHCPACAATSSKSLILPISVNCFRFLEYVVGLSAPPANCNFAHGDQRPAVCRVSKNVYSWASAADNQSKRLLARRARE